MKKKIFLILILGVFLISFISATQTIKFDTGTGRISASSDDASDPVTFQDIYDYFQANPIPVLDYPQRLGGNPYELCENNSDEWFGRNGMSNATNDNLSYAENNYSIQASVLSLPSNIPFTYSRTDSQNLYIYMSDTSNISLGDEVKLTRSDGSVIITKITYIATNSYIRGYAPRGFRNLGNDYGGTLQKPLALIWNDNMNVTSFGASITNQIRFSAKSNGTSSPKITDVIVRNTYTDNNPNDYSHLVYGAYITKNFNLTSSWQDFNITIRDMTNWAWPKDGSARGYWFQVKKIYFFFDNLSVGDSVWLDGVRFTNSNPNPTNPAQNTYVFTTGLYVQKYFKDSGFNVRFDILDTYGIASSTYKGYTPGVSFINYGDYGDIQLGDYDGSSSIGHEGGSITFNHFCIEDTGKFYLSKVESQGITFQDFKHSYGGWYFADAPNSIFRNCNFINNLNFYGANNVTIENCAWMGGRYFNAFPSSMTIKGVSVYAPNYYGFFLRRTGDEGATPIPFFNAKMFGPASYQVIHADNWGDTVESEAYRFVNFDVSEIDNPIYGYGHNTAYIHDLRNYFAFSFDLKVTDENNTNLENANVTLKDKDGNVLFSVLTDANGTIPEQYVDYYKAYSSGASKNFHFENESDWTTYYPYTLIIEKTGYSTYEKKFFNHYDKTSDIVKNGANWVIALSPPSGGGTTVICDSIDLACSTGTRIVSSREYPYVNYKISPESDTTKGLLLNPYIIKTQ